MKPESTDYDSDVKVKSTALHLQYVICNMQHADPLLCHLSPDGWTPKILGFFSGVVLWFRDRNGHQSTLSVDVDQSSNIPLLSSSLSFSDLFSVTLTKRRLSQSD